MTYDVWQDEPFHVFPADLATLSKRLGGHLELRGDACVVRRVVGHITLPSGNVCRIRSRKAEAASILAWMAHADPSCRALSLHGWVHDATGTGGIAELLARLFVVELLEAAYRYGLVRAYRRCDVSTSTVRGRIDFAKLSRQGGDLSKLPCAVWERLPETELNQFLAAALRAVETDVLMAAAVADILPNARSLMSGVRPTVASQFLSAGGGLARNERHFAIAFSLARLILRSVGLGEGKGWKSPSYLVNLESLFEATVVKAFRDANVAIEANAPAHYYECGVDVKPRPMFLDLVVKGLPGGPVVVDAKFKTSVSSSNLQQVVTYCVMVGATRAFLVFPSACPARFKPGTWIVVNGKGPWAHRQVRVDIAVLQTDGKDVAAWRRAGSDLVREIVGSLVAGVGNPDPPALPLVANPNCLAGSV